MAESRRPIYPINLEDALRDDIQEDLQQIFGSVLEKCGLDARPADAMASPRIEDAEAELIGAMLSWILSQGLTETDIVAAQRRLDGFTSGFEALRRTMTRSDDTASA